MVGSDGKEIVKLSQEDFINLYKKSMVWKKLTIYKK